MPQQPMQQGIASIGGAPTGVRGGVVAFQVGGETQADKDERKTRIQFLKDYAKTFGQVLGTPPTVALDVAMGLSHPFREAAYTLGLTEGNPEYRSTTKKLWSDGSPAVPAAAQPAVANANDPYRQSQPYDIGQSAVKETVDKPAVVAPDPSAEAQKKISALLPTNMDLAGVQKAQEDYLRYLEDVAKKPTWNEADYKKALGDRTADTKKFYTELEGIFPDSTQEFRNQIKTLKEENLSEKTKAPYQGLLKMSLSLMSNTGRNFLDALGKAGATGMEEYNSIMQMNKRQNLLLMESDAKMAVAQDNRRNNLYGLASSQAAEAKQDRIRAFDLEKDSKAQQVGLAVKIAEIKAGTPLKMMELRTNLAKAGASIYSAYKTDSPEAVKLWRFAQSDPEFAAYLQTQEHVKRASTGYLALSKLYDDELRAATAAGQDKFPSRDTWIGKQFIEYMKVTDPSVRGKMPGS